MEFPPAKAGRYKEYWVASGFSRKISEQIRQISARKLNAPS